MVNYNKIKKLVESNGVTFAHLSARLNKNRTYLNTAIRDNRNLSLEQIAIIAEALHTTPDYLTDKTDDPEIKKAPADIGQRNRDIREIIDLYDSLSADQKKQAVDFLAFLKSQEKG